MQSFTFQADSQDLSIRVQQEASRHPTDTIKHSRIRIPILQIRYMCPCQLIFFDGCCPLVFVSIQRPAQYCIILVLKLFPSSNDVWIFLAAIRTPGSPKIYQYILATERRKTYWLTIHIRQCEVWSNRTNLYLLQACNHVFNLTDV